MQQLLVKHRWRMIKSKKRRYNKKKKKRRGNTWIDTRYLNGILNKIKIDEDKKQKRKKKWLKNSYHYQFYFCFGRWHRRHNSLMVNAFSTKIFLSFSLLNVLFYVIFLLLLSVRFFSFLFFFLCHTSLNS